MRAIGAAACLAITLLAGCSAESRQSLLPVFFDGVPEASGGAGSGQTKPAPPTHRVRRDLLLEIEELKRQVQEAEQELKAREAPAAGEEVRLPVEKTQTFEEAKGLLPKDAAGRVDWMQALASGTVRPRSGITVQTPEQAALDLDVDLTGSGNALFSVTYPHRPHTQWLACGNCHPAIFPISRKAPPSVISMARIRNGEQCGVCHGKVAFPVDKECGRCHTKTPARSDWHPVEEPRTPIERASSPADALRLLPVTAGMPDWAKALAEGVIAPRPGIDPKAQDQPAFPLDVELVPADNALFKVVFPHGTHTALLACTTCHPGIFQMAKGADPITMGAIYGGQYCGTCHGKVAFAVPTGCPRCHPALAGGK
jgi:c(7)-type cytochrome triheme protein